MSNKFGNGGKKSLQMRDIPWLCKNCKYMLGVISQDKTEVRFKYKDFYARVRGGSVEVICRRCGEINKLSEEAEEVDIVG